MLDVINLLPDSVANQIAAGEVVQRPASVVKELLENSIDAGATKIELHVFEAGKAGIQVVDNGVGLSPSDARMCFERHATSKIREASDLGSIATMGFRGEALASIASVAEVQLTTRREEDEMGFQISVAASRVGDYGPVACQKGASFLVRNLFFNVPARRRFLKSDSVEMKHIINEFQRVALSNPQVAMQLENDSNTLYSLPASSRADRIVAIFGNRLRKALIPISVQTDSVVIEGFIGTPAVARRRGGEQFLFVNARYMRSPYLNRAVVNAYDKLIPSDSLPIFFIYFALDPASIDVNIHPQKTEVKFENDQLIWQLLHSSVREALGKFGGLPQIDFNPSSIYSRDFVPPSAPVALSDEERRYAEGSYPARRFTFPGATKGQGEWSTPASDIRGNLVPSALNPPTAPAPVLPSETLQCGRYIVASTPEGLLLVNCYRARTRILYEQLESQGNLIADSAQLLFPPSVTLTAEELVHIEEFIDVAKQLGLTLERKGESDVTILSAPAWVNLDDPATFLRDLLEAYLSGERSLPEEAQNRQRAAMASAAIPRGEQRLALSEQTRILRDLFQCQKPARDPNGNRTYILLKPESIESLFTKHE